jgi:predicted TPR repeat methyltransferase
VDLSGEMLARARGRGGYDELFREDIQGWLARQPTASIDCAVALDVFIYLGDLSAVVPACAAALARGGILAFTIERLEEGATFALRASGRYAHAPGEVQALCERSGLRLAESREFAIRTEAGSEIPAVFFVFERQ